MDLTEMSHQLASHVTPVTVIVFVLFIASEVLGSIESVKASSLFGIGKALLNTFKDQAFPNKVIETEKK